MKKLSKEQIFTLHSMAIKQSGGMDGIRDDGLLDMSLNSPYDKHLDLVQKRGIYRII